MRFDLGMETPNMPRPIEPLVELLAIKLYEHDQNSWPPSKPVPGWLELEDEYREHFREMARGNADLAKVRIMVV